jgi:acyl-CoA synthetase (AMP-forming)/AMP-acid ligase II
MAGARPRAERDVTAVALADLLLVDDRNDSRAALCGRALALAAGLQTRGIRHIAAYFDSAHELACVLLGAWRAGVCVTLPADLHPQTFERLSGSVRHWLSDTGHDGTCAPDDLMAAPLPAQRLDLDSQCLVLATSGSSGESKLIGKTLAQLSNEVAVLQTLWGCQLGAATIVGSVSTQHIYGLLFRVLWPLSAGRPIDARQWAFPEDLQRATLDHGDVAWVSSPALLKRIGDNLDWPALHGRVRKVFSSGGELPADAARALQQRLGQAPIEIYGSSETGGIGWRQGTPQWTPFPGTQISRDADGSLWVRSPYLPEGHAEHMADAVRIEADGFHLLGRLDRIVKLEEKRISLPRIERILAGHCWIDEARLGMVHAGRAYIGALVALTEAGIKELRARGRRALIAALRQALGADVEELAWPRRWRFMRQLPGNAQGKLRQVDVDAQLQAERPLSPIVNDIDMLDDTLSIQLEVPLDLAHFSGHFASAPVLPGVLQIGWAVNLARQHFQLPPRFAGMEVIKFQRLLRPGDRSLLELRFDAARGKLHFNYRCNDAPCSSGRILLDGNHA